MNSSVLYADSIREMKFTTAERYFKEYGPNVKIHRVYSDNSMIVLLNHPASITVYQYVSIKVLSGSVSVMGYEVNEDSRPFHVFSSIRTGYIEVKTETYDRIWKKREDYMKLAYGLERVTHDKNAIASILSKFGSFSVLIVLQRCALPANLQYLELYYPHVITFKKFKHCKRDQYYVESSTSKGLEFGPDVENLASEINSCIRSSMLLDTPAPRVLICGPKNTGKSTLLRFLINKALSADINSCYLDTDPGQTEFTPPGLVSLTYVDKPVVGPPFVHQRKPVSMIFTGGISADSSPDMYCKSISKLMELYKNKFSDTPLFVNTMGWMEGLGLQCLQNVVLAVKPTVLIELVNEDEVSMFDYRDHLPENSNYVQICHSFTPKAGALSSPEIREMSLLSYFGKCQSTLEGPVYLNEIKPYCVNWDKIPIYLFGKKVPPQRMIEAINGSIVALCNVPETSILESDIPEYPKTLEDEPDNECLGYGLVRAIDEEQHLLYIITPLKLTELKQVNAIIKGNIMVPIPVFLNQPICNTPLPFTNEREIPPPVNEEEMADCSMLTLKSVSDIESPAANFNARASQKAFRQKVSKRYRHKRT